MFKKAFILLLVLVSWNQSSALHLAGGEIFYECVGNNRYAITLKIYRDCNGNGANFDDNARFTIYQASNNSILQTFTIPRPDSVLILPFNQDIRCLLDTPDICISTVSYIDTIDLSVPLGGAYVVHSRCCRPANVINVQNISSTGNTYAAFIPDSTIAPCNSSPYYNGVPPTAICADVDFEFDYSATDLDGDSLVYRLCTPFHGGSQNNPAPWIADAPPFTQVSWELGFDEDNQITAWPAVTIDSVTGLLSGRPTQQGVFAFGVCVQEWRDGVFLSENKRDFQFTTTMCEIDAAAAIDSAIEECVGFDIQFFNLSTLGDSFRWDFGDTTALDDTSYYDNPIYTFPDTGTYMVQLIAFGEVCSDTSWFPYRVQHKIEPYFDPPDPDCLDGHRYEFIPEGYYRETTQIRWEFEGDTADIFGEEVPIATKVYDTLGWHKITLHYKDPKLGCYKYYTDSIQVYPNPILHLNEPPDGSCAPYFGNFSTSVEHAFKPTYLWMLDSTVISDSSSAYVESYDIGPHDLRIILMTDSMCVDTLDSFFVAHVNVLDTPSAGFSVDPYEQDMFFPDFTLYDESSNRLAWKFFVDGEYVSPNSIVEVTMSDTGWHTISQIARHPNGCADTAYDQVKVTAQYLTFIPNSFSPNSNGRNDTWKPSVFEFGSYELKVSNRWGEVVFTSYDPEIGWNGQKHNDGPPCPVGVYTYDLLITDKLGEPYNYQGRLNLIH